MMGALYLRASIAALLSHGLSIRPRHVSLAKEPDGKITMHFPALMASLTASNVSRVLA